MTENYDGRAPAAQRRAEAARRGEILHTTPPRTRYSADGGVAQRNRWDSKLTTDTVPGSMIEDWGRNPEPAPTSAGSTDPAPVAEPSAPDPQVRQGSDGW